MKRILTFLFLLFSISSFAQPQVLSRTNTAVTTNRSIQFYRMNSPTNMYGNSFVLLEIEWDTTKVLSPVFRVKVLDNHLSIHPDKKFVAADDSGNVYQRSFDDVDFSISQITDLLDSLESKYTKSQADGLFVPLSRNITINGTQYDLTSDRTWNVGTLVAADTVSKWKPIGYVPAWSEITGKPSFATVATSGDYGDLSNKPTIPTNTNQLTNGAGFITGVNSGDITSALGYTPVTNARTVTVNGVTHDLSANRTWSVGTLVGSDTVSLSNRINTKLTIPSGTTSQYVRGDGTLATFPTIPSTTSQISEGSNLYYTDARSRAAISLTTTGSGAATYNSSTGVLNVPTPATPRRIETYTGTTNASGNYTVTYSTAFANVPDIQPQMQAGNFNQFIRITSSTTTGFTVQVAQRNSVTLLGIEVLLASTVVVNGASVGVLVTER